MNYNPSSVNHELGEAETQALEAKASDLAIKMILTRSEEETQELDPLDEIHRDLDPQVSCGSAEADLKALAEAAINRKKSILEEAQDIIHGARRKQYGHPSKNFGDIARLWEVIFGCPITGTQVALAMIALKIARHNHGQDRDSILDIAGYVGCIELIQQDKG